MTGNGQWERESIRHLADISKSARQAGDALVEIGRMIKEYMGIDLEEIQRNTDRLNELARQMEQASVRTDHLNELALRMEQASVRPGMYVPDQDGKMQLHEWMQNLNVHYEPIDPSIGWPKLGPMSKDDFWDFINAMDSSGLIRKVKPEPIKDPDQGELPLQISTEFFVDDRVQISDRTNENYLRVGKIEGIDDKQRKARVRFSESSEGVLIGVFDFLQMAVLKDPPAEKTETIAGMVEPHQNINDCVAAGCDGHCGRTDDITEG